MPFVPVVNDQPTNTPDYQGGNVPAMPDNGSAARAQQTGAQLENAGLKQMSRAQALQQHIQGQMDDANVNAAETKLIAAATDALHGENGYMNKQGADALNSIDTYKQSLAKTKKDLQESLGNDVQKQMFDLRAQRHLVTIGGQMATHQAQQRKEYTYNEQVAAVDTAVTMTQQSEIGSPDHELYRATAIKRTQDALAIRGIPADSEEAKKAVRGVNTSIVSDDIARLMAANKYDEAKKYLSLHTDRDKFMAVQNPKGMVEKGNLPINDRPIVKNADGSISSEYSISVEDNGKEVLIPTVVDGKFLTPDGKKPEEGSNEEKAMFRAATEHYQKTGENLGKFDSVENANAYSEQLHSRGPGIDPEVANRLRASIQSNVERVENINTADKIISERKGLDAKDLEDMLGKVDSQVTDPEQRKQVRSLVAQQYSQLHAIEQAKYADNYSAVVEYKYSHHGSLKGVDPNQWGMLDAKDRYELSKPPAVETDINTLYGFITKPETLTVDNVKTAWGKGLLSKESFISLTEHAMMLGKDKTYVQEAGDINNRIDYFANQAGIPVFKTGKEEGDKAQEALMKYRIQTDIEKVKQQNKGKVTGEQVDQIIKRELTQQILNVPRAPLSPMRLFGSKTYEEKRTTFQIPTGATGVMRGDDGKLHYTDGKTDLGVAE